MMDFAIYIAEQIILIMMVTHSADFLKCPHPSQWGLRFKAVCKTRQEYHCLFDMNKQIDKEFCYNKPEAQRRGFRYVIRGSLDAIECVKEFYQPYKFWPNVTSQCAYHKSVCSEEGQVLVDNGNTISDVACRCDYTQGYAFVIRPEHECFCIPSAEDCSCYRKTCQQFHVLTPDYNCITIGNWTGNFNCKEIRPSTDMKSTVCPTSQAQVKEDTKPASKDRFAATFLTVTIGICLFFVIICVCIWSHFWNRLRIAFQKKIKKEVRLEIDAMERQKRQDYNEHIPNDRRDLYEEYLKQWKKDDEKFTETSAYREVKRKLQNKKCAVVIGGSGSGKSAILKHIALQLSQEEEYDVIPFVLSPSYIHRYYHDKRKQVFILDDVCGKLSIHVPLVDVWSLDMAKIFELLYSSTEGSLLLLFSSSRDIYNDKYFEKLNQLKQFEVDLSLFPLNQDEKDAMLQKYISCSIPSIEDHIPNEDIFPVLCKLAEGKNETGEIQELFSKPFEVIKRDIKRLKETEIISFLLLSLCVLFDNNLDVELFNVKSEHGRKYSKDLEEICDEFGLDFAKESTRSKMKEQLDNETNLYLKGIGTYHFLHEKIFDIAVQICGESLLRVFIKYATRTMIGNRFLFLSVLERHEKENDFFIRIDPANEENYFDRLIRDLECDHVYSTLHNSQLQYSEFRKKLCEYFYSKKPKMLRVFGQIKEKAFTEEAEETDEKLKMYEDYINFTKPHHFAKHIMNLPLIESVWEGHSDIIKMLIQLGCSSNEEDKYGRSALFIGSNLGKTEAVQVLLENGADISKCDNKGRSPLYIASKEGYDEIVINLLKNGADPNQCDLNGRTPLYVASENGHTNILTKLLERSKKTVHRKDKFGRTPLIAAASRGKNNSVILLLQNGATVNEFDKQGRSAAFEASANGHIKVLELLLGKNADFQHEDVDGHSPVFMASKGGYSEVLKALIRNIPMLLTSKEKERSFFIACEKGHVDVVTFLLEKLADVNSVDEEGRPALVLACGNGHEEIVNILLKNHANVNQGDKNNRSPLYNACKGGFIEIVKMLVEKDASISTYTDWGGSPLFVACREGHMDVVEFLISNGAVVNKKDSRGDSPLYVACEEGHDEIARFLIEKNAQVNSVNNHLRSPLHAACIFGHTKVIKLLLDIEKCVIDKDVNGKTPIDIAKEKFTVI